MRGLYSSKTKIRNQIFTEVARFAMIMLVEIDKSNIGFEQLRTNLKAVGESTNTKVHVMHEDIFNSMHRI